MQGAALQRQSITSSRSLRFAVCGGKPKNIPFRRAAHPSSREIWGAAKFLATPQNASGKMREACAALGRQNKPPGKLIPSGGTKNTPLEACTSPESVKRKGGLQSDRSGKSGGILRVYSQMAARVCGFYILTFPSENERSKGRFRVFEVVA